MGEWQSGRGGVGGVRGRRVLLRRLSIVTQRVESGNGTAKVTQARTDLRL